VRAAGLRRAGGRAETAALLIERDIENAWLASDNEAGPLDDLIGHSITYRIAVGPRAGEKLFTLQTVPACAAITRPLSGRFTLVGAPDRFRPLLEDRAA